jgi:hypothetical protein
VLAAYRCLRDAGVLEFRGARVPARPRRAGDVGGAAPGVGRAGGLQVRCGVLGWPRCSYPRDSIVSGEAIAVSIWRTWNWGFSWTPRGGWSFILRSGPAIRLTLLDGRRVTVGVDDPAAALTAFGLIHAQIG